MDDFEYSVQISERDWDSFFQVCEDCNMLPPVLAGLDDSGMSDMDEMASQRTRPATQIGAYDSELQIDGPPDCEVSPMDLYLSKYGLSSPEQVLSGSEEDFHLEAVNVFFEKLKSVSATNDHTIAGKMAGHSDGSVEKKDVKGTVVPVEIFQSFISQSGQRNDGRTYTYNVSTDDDLEGEKHKSTCPETKLLIKEEDWSLEVLKEGDKWETKLKNYDLYKEMRPKPDIGKSSCDSVANGKELTDPNQVKEANSQRITSNNSDSTELLVGQGQASNVTPRKRRKKKKRISIELVETDHGYAQFQGKQIESDEDIFVRSEEMGQETHMPECCGLRTDSKACYRPHSFLPLPKINSILKSFPVCPQSLPVNADIRTPIAACPNLPKTHQEFSSTIRDAQNKKEMGLMHESNLTGKPASTGQFAMRADLKSPEPGVSVKGTPQSDDSLSAPSNGDNVGNHLQLNNYLPSEMKAVPKESDVLPVSITTCDVSKIGVRKPKSIENLILCSEELKEDIKLSVSHHTDYVDSQTNSAALQLTTLIPSDPVVCSKTPNRPLAQCQLEDRVMLSDFQFDGSGAVCQRKTSMSDSISCVTFPELTEKAAFSASYNNAEETDNSSSVIHDEVPSEHKNEHDWQGKESLSDTFYFKLLTQSDPVNIVKAQISPQNGQMNAHNAQMQAAQRPIADVIKNTPLIESKSEITNQVSKKAAISNTSAISQSEDWREEISLSLRPKDIPESKKDINMKDIETLSLAAEYISKKAVEILSTGTEAKNEELSLKGQTKECQSLIYTTEPDSQLSDDSKSKPTASNITTGEERKGQILDVDKPPHFSSKDYDLSPTAVVQCSPSPTPESTGGAKSLETAHPDTVSQPTPSIYAISSFWNEMEKLTINDILQLRLVGQAQHPSALLQPEDSSIADVTDPEDSGYFTHLDESKPDRSSEDMSFISDFDEELAQLLTQDAAKPGEGSRESPNPGGIVWECDPDLSRTGTGMEDVFTLSSETAHSSPLYRNNSNHCFRKMCKNISVQNLQALEGQNLRKILRNASLHSIHSVYSTHSEVEDDYVDSFNRADTSSPVYLSDDDEEMDSTGITFSEVFEYLFGVDEPERSASAADTIATSYLNGTGTSVPEMYDHFFSEFEPESFFYPLSEDNSSTKEELVPIFSCSHSATRNLQFPEVYDYFFPDDSPVHSDEDEEPDHTVIQVVTRYDHMVTKNDGAVAALDPYEHFFSEKDYSWNFLGRNPFSFRRVRRTGFTVPPEESSSWALTPVKNRGRSFHRGVPPINALGADESPFQEPLILSLENRIFRQLAEQQKICSEMQTAVADPRVDAPLLPIKQADMCLVCIAFASWVLKSVNPQGTDTWKAVLLANISALSAIRYLRKFTRDEAAKITPLRQIEST